MPKYLDANGNPISTDTHTYLDPNTGEPLKAEEQHKSVLQSLTEGAQPGDGAIKGFVKNVVAGAADNISHLAHPFEGKSTAEMTNPGVIVPKTDHSGALDEVKGMVENPGRTIGQVGGGMLLGEMGGRVAGAVTEAVPRIAGKAVLLGKTPEGAYESALKPSPAIPAVDRAAAVKTGLEQEVPISKGGLEKLKDHIETLNNAIKGEIASDPTRPIDPNKVATRADAAKAKFAKQVNAGGDLAAIDASKAQFLSEQGATPGKFAPDMNAIDAQEMKQGTYRVLKGKFGEQGSAAVEAQKALARGLKEEIATQFPEIAKLNATESKLLDLQPILERAVNRISNHQAVGIGTPVAGAAAKAITGSGGVGVVASVLKGVLDNPNVKSRLAIAVSKSQKIPYSQAAAKVQAYSSALGASVAASQASSGNPDQSDTQQTAP